MRKFAGGGGLETQLNWVSNIQGQIVQGVQQFAHAVDNKLTQNDQRNETQSGMINELYTAVQNSAGEIGKNQKGNVLIHQKCTSVERKMGGIDNAIEGVGKGTSSFLQNRDAKMHGELRLMQLFRKKI